MVTFLRHRQHSTLLTVLIRHADPVADAAACVDIYRPFVTDSAVSFDITVPTVEEFSAKIAHLSETHAFLIGDADGVVAGYAYSGPYRERAAYRWSAEVSVYVHPDFRGRGVGRELYDALLGLMRRQGIRTAIAGITQPNPGSMALHHSCGFRTVGVFERIGYKAGAWRDVAFLALELQPEADRSAIPEEPRRERLDTP
jgi:L-amino acid N-acyltransferase YncA